MSTMTIRGIDEEIAAALKKKAKEEGTSINAITLRLLRDSLGFKKSRRLAVHHDLDHLAGTWSENDAKEFERRTAVFEKVDPDLWKDSEG